MGMDAATDKLKARIQALRAKTVDNGCTEDEALAAAAKVADLLDRHDLSLGDVERRAASCERAVYAVRAGKRMPIGDCVGAIARFCDCRVWREKSERGGVHYVFFGLPADTAIALYLAGLIDGALRAELGRYKQSAAYLRLRHQDRHLANASFALGMAASIASRLEAMKDERDGADRRSGRGLVVAKSSIVDEEMERLGLTFRTTRSAGRTVSPESYDAGGGVGQGLAIGPALATRAPGAS